jgi:hypothetical protein
VRDSVPPVKFLVLVKPASTARTWTGTGLARDWHAVTGERPWPPASETGQPLHAESDGRFGLFWLFTRSAQPVIVLLLCYRTCISLSPSPPSLRSIVCCVAPTPSRAGVLRTRALVVRAAENMSSTSIIHRVGFLGAGQMAEALARGFIKKGVVQSSQLCCTDVVASRKDLFRTFGVAPFDTSIEVLPTAAVGLRARIQTGVLC